MSEEKVPEAKAKKAKASVGFVGPDGASLRLAWKVRKDGSVQTWATHRAGKEAKATRGATETHPSLEKAEVAMEKLVAQALKIGWTRKERKGFAAKSDAFTELPAPAKAKTGKK